MSDDDKFMSKPRANVSSPVNLDSSARNSKVLEICKNLHLTLTAKLNSNLAEVRDVIDKTNSALVEMVQTVTIVVKENVKLTSECEALKNKNSKLVLELR